MNTLGTGKNLWLGKFKVTILVTGGFGHIGSKLIVELAKFREIVVVDSLKTMRYSSIYSLSQKNPIFFLETDLLQLSLKDLERFQNITHIVHLAAKNDNQFLVDNNFEINLQLTRIVVKLAKDLSAQLIFPSSSSVYSESSKYHREGDELLLTKTGYQGMKIQEERLILSSNLERYIILRLGTIHGVSPGMRFHTAINKFCWEASTKGIIEVWENAYEQVRPYLAVLDCVSVISRIIDDSSVPNGIYNVATDHYQTSHVIELIHQAYKGTFKVKFLESPSTSPQNLRMSTDKIAEYGFHISGNLRVDIQQTLELLAGVKWK